MSLDWGLIQTRQREAVPLELAFIADPIGSDVGIGFEIDDMPAAFGAKSQVDDAFQYLVLVERKQDWQFTVQALGIARSGEQGMPQRGRNGCGRMFAFRNT